MVRVPTDVPPENQSLGRHRELRRRRLKSGASNHIVIIGARFGATSGDPGHPPPHPDFARRRRRHPPPPMRHVSKLRGPPAKHHHGGTLSGLISADRRPGRRALSVGPIKRKRPPTRRPLDADVCGPSVIGCASLPPKEHGPGPMYPPPPTADRGQLSRSIVAVPWAPPRASQHGRAAASMLLVTDLSAASCSVRKGPGRP